MDSKMATEIAPKYPPVPDRVGTKARGCHTV